MFASRQRLLHQGKSTLWRCAKRNGIDLRTVFEQFAQGPEVIHPGARQPLRGDSHQLKRGVGVDGWNVLILGNLAVAHQPETNRLHR
nr:hypothetical protein GCM10020185_80360 [Pseudomonas brassicacearum subsp. brassicacearum]